MEPKQKQYLVVHVTGDRSNIRSCKEQYCIGTWNVRSMKVKVKSLTRVRLFATPWTIAHQAPLSMGFSRQEYWSGLPFPSPGDLPDPGIKPRSPALQADALTSEPPGKGGKAPFPSHLSLELYSMWFSPGYQRALHWVFRHQYSK